MSDSLWPPWTAAYQVSLSITNCPRFFKLMSFEPVMPSNCLILCPLLLLPFWIFSNIRVFTFFISLSLSLSLYFSLFLSLFCFLTLQYCIGFTIYQHESSGSFQMRQLFTSGSQSIGVSASIAALPMNIQDWAPLQWTGWISLQSKGFSRIFSNTRVQKHQFFGAQLPL